MPFYADGDALCQGLGTRLYGFGRRKRERSEIARSKVTKTRSYGFLSVRKEKHCVRVLGEYSANLGCADVSMFGRHTQRHKAAVLSEPFKTERDALRQGLGTILGEFGMRSSRCAWLAHSKTWNYVCQHVQTATHCVGVWGHYSADVGYEKVNMRRRHTQSHEVTVLSVPFSADGNALCRGLGTMLCGCGMRR